MKPFDRQGTELDAIFSIKNANGVELILESRGGGEGGSKPPRNPDYGNALEVLLERLGELGASLERVEVYSRITKSWPSDDRTLSPAGYTFPIKLGELVDPHDFRLKLGQESAALGNKTGKGGNRTKRLRLFLSWVDAASFSTDEIEQILAGTKFQGRAVHPQPNLKYSSLGDYLRQRDLPEIRLKLSEIEALINAVLPAEARKPQFWANSPANHAERRSQWLGAGYRAFYEKRTETVRFEKPVPTPVPFESEEETDDPEILKQRVRAARKKLKRTKKALPPLGKSDVEQKASSIWRYVRDPDVIAWVLNEAKNHCEVCDSEAPFLDANDDPFLEVHHVRPLGEGGPDQVDNAVAACPNCHRLLHYGKDRDEVRKRTISRIERLNDYPVVLK